MLKSTVHSVCKKVSFAGLVCYTLFHPPKNFFVFGLDFCLQDSSPSLYYIFSSKFSYILSLVLTAKAITITTKESETNEANVTMAGNEK